VTNAKGFGGTGAYQRNLYGQPLSSMKRAQWRISYVRRRMGSVTEKAYHFPTRKTSLFTGEYEWASVSMTGWQ